jgi:hypothetical protein
MSFREYEEVVVESYTPNTRSGLRGPVHIRPAPGQTFPQDIHVECSKSLSQEYPVGTRFKIRAKLTSRQGGKPFLYSYFGWPVQVLKEKG